METCEHCSGSGIVYTGSITYSYGRVEPLKATCHVCTGTGVVPNAQYQISLVEAAVDKAFDLKTW